MSLTTREVIELATGAHVLCRPVADVEPFLGADGGYGVVADWADSYLRQLNYTALCAVVARFDARVAVRHVLTHRDAGGAYIAVAVMYDAQDNAPLAVVRFAHGGMQCGVADATRLGEILTYAIFGVPLPEAAAHIIQPTFLRGLDTPWLSRA